VGERPSADRAERSIEGCVPTIGVLIGLGPDTSPDAGRPIEEIVGAPAATVAHLSR
jgi:hypothetical protein